MSSAARLSVKSGEAEGKDIYYQLPDRAERRRGDQRLDESDQGLGEPGERLRQFFSPGEELEHLREKIWAGWAPQG